MKDKARASDTSVVVSKNRDRTRVVVPNSCNVVCSLGWICMNLHRSQKPCRPQYQREAERQGSCYRRWRTFAQKGLRDPSHLQRLLCSSGDTRPHTNFFDFQRPPFSLLAYGSLSTPTLHGLLITCPSSSQSLKITSCAWTQLPLQPRKERFFHEQRQGFHPAQCSSSALSQ